MLNSWWPSGFMWDRGKERYYIWGEPSLPASSCVGSLGYLMLSPPQFHNSTQREEYFLKGYTVASSVPCYFWDLCSFLPPQMSLPSVTVGSDWFLRHRDRPYAKSKVHTSGKHGAFLTSFVFLQHLRIPTTKQNKKAKCICWQPFEPTWCWLILKNTNR